MIGEVFEGMKPKRSREMIMQNILEVCAHGASKTRIVYQSNLNFTTANSYLAQLLDNGLMEINQGESTYQTTKKGAEFMESLKQHHDEILKLSSFLAHA